MANIDRPNGFTNAKREDGGDWSGNIRPYTASNRTADNVNNHGDIYLGATVKLVSKLVLIADSGDTQIGVVVGIGTKPTFGDGGPFNTGNLSQQYSPYTDTGVITVWVIPKQGMLFEMQTSSALSLGQGSNADISTTAATAHGSRSTGHSTVELVAAVNNDVEVVENVLTPNNDITLTNARHLVKLA